MPMSTLLTAAYLRAAERLQASEDEPIVNIPTAGRIYPGVDARYTVGCFAQNMSLDFPRMTDAPDVGDYLARIHERYATAIAHGYDRAQNKVVARTMRDTEMLEGGAVTPVASGLLTSMVKTNLYLPYLGTVPIQAAYGDLAVRDYEAATSTNPGTIDTIAEIFDGRLQLAAGSDSRSVSADMVDALLAGVETALQELVQCPVSANGSETPETTTVPVDDSLAVTVRWIAEDVGGMHFGPEDMSRDIEADLGLDSLERVRIISRLGQTLDRAIDRRALLDCRSLRQMVESLTGEMAGTASPADTATGAAEGVASPCRRARPCRPPMRPHRVVPACRFTESWNSAVVRRRPSPCSTMRVRSRTPPSMSVRTDWRGSCATSVSDGARPRSESCWSRAAT
jgi:acyl carrier protein